MAQKETLHSEEREAFYLGFSGYSLPLKPTHPVSKDEALTHLGSYYRAEFDSSGDLRVIEKYVRGELEFRHDYSYYPTRIIQEARITRRDGKVIVHRFDETGRTVDQQ